MLIEDEDNGLCAEISKPVFMHLSRKSTLVWPNLAASIFHPGTESVQLKRMWLQSYCLAAITTETRGQGKDSKQLDESRMSCNFTLKVLELKQIIICSPVCFTTDLTTLTTCGDSPTFSSSYWAFPPGASPQSTCRGRHVPLTWPMSPTPNKDHHRPEHKLSLSLLSPLQHNCT